jgi:hypothetical protein
VVSRAEVFDRNRPLLFSIANRMTGSVMEADAARGYLRAMGRRCRIFEVPVPGKTARFAKARWCARIRLTERSAGKTSCARG